MEGRIKRKYLNLCAGQNIILSFPYIVFVLTDSRDPDEMSCYSTFRLRLHCLSKFAFLSVFKVVLPRFVHFECNLVEMR